MLRRLTGLGLITYRRYRDIALTEAGERSAHAVIRRHRLAERLLTDMLGVPLDQAHDEACRLEHAVSPALEGRMAEALGGPSACPHGHPIDAAAADHSIGLTEAPLNRQLAIARLDDESPEVVRYLAGLGLLPGARLTVKLREPRDGAVVVEVAGVIRTLGPELAAGVRVTRPQRTRGT
jgi:DtxR family Mn-dependent transcriptional regulator